MNRLVAKSETDLGRGDIAYNCGGGVFVQIGLSARQGELGLARLQVSPSHINERLESE